MNHDLLYLSGPKVGMSLCISHKSVLAESTDPVHSR
jgi:hypothetical protein